LPQVFNVKPSSSYYFWLMAPALIVLAAINQK